MIFNLQLNFLSAAIIILMLRGNKESHVYLPENSSFRKLLVHLMILLLLDTLTWVLNMQNFKGAYMLNVLVNYAYYADQALIVYEWGMYGHSLMGIRLSPAARWVHRLPMTAGLFLLACNPFTQSVFTISQENVYSRGWGLWGVIYAVCVFFYLVEIMVMSGFRLRHTGQSDRRDRINLLISSALPVLGAIIQMLQYGTNMIWSFGVLGLLILYFNVQTRRAALAERELEEKRIAIMLSQIQPHFLYNALLGIKDLCKKDPKAAAKALEHFSYFLRGNLDSLSDMRLICFEKELIHVKDYLYLEKMRFDDKIQIVWDLQYMDFMLPSLTLQPIAENAVRYGITKKRDGGTLTIRSEKIQDEVIVTVSDDGIGFDIHETREDGRTHIGIENVQKRLELQCGGRLEIESRRGEGTVARLILPQRRITQHEEKG